MNTMSTTVIARLGAWLSSLRYEDIPSDVVEHMKLCLLDGIGCGLFGARQPWGSMVSELASELGGRPGVTLFGRGETASPPNAALANGTAIHGYEIDDVHVSSSLHPAAVTIPAALAVAEAEGRSGRDLLLALAAGYEIGIRVGICAGVSHSTSGFHVTGTVGTFAAAAAAASCLKLDATASAHAIALGATQASGLYAARKGAMAKRFHAGRAAESGVLAALLARKGFTGALNGIEAQSGGFMSTMKGQFDPETILEGLGENWECRRVGFKLYAACASAHTTIDAVRELTAAGLRADNLQHLTISLSKKGAMNVGWPYQPVDIVSAQMNGSFAAAIQLLEGDAFVKQYRQDRLADPDVLTLIAKMEFRHEPELDAGGAANRHRVTAVARMTDGRVLETDVPHRTGSAERPVGRQRIEQKFFSLCDGIVPPAQAHAIASTIATMDAQATLRELGRHLSATH
ncbi:MmgE/PrpD family protein [Shinella sp.]|uniref:MmgE/PrpD family protein n=1 Tax=Shinella sp. TaxID=1870904 RepID=UPI003F6E79AB